MIRTQPISLLKLFLLYLGGYLEGAGITKVTTLIYPNGTVTPGPTSLPVDNAHNHSWVNLPDGRIALCAEYNRIFIYDPITNTFESVASTQYYLYLFTCGVFNCEIYDFRPTLIAMGITGDGAKETRFQIYDYTTDGASWTYSEYFKIIYH